jgi:hypothetical protein
MEWIRLAALGAIIGFLIVGGVNQARAGDRPLPVPSTGACPGGYSYSPTASVCVPGPNTTQRAIPQQGYKACPPGWHASPNAQMCVENAK